MRPRRGGAVAVTTTEVVLWVFEELTCIGSKMGTAWVERVRHAFRGWIWKYIHRHDTAPDKIRNDVTLARLGWAGQQERLRSRSSENSNDRSLPCNHNPFPMCRHAHHSHIQHLQAKTARVR